MENKYYFCYSTNVYKFLKSKKVSHICQAKNVNSDKVFWLYERSETLHQHLKEYSKQSRLMKNKG